jgi:hypothetical protein
MMVEVVVREMTAPDFRNDRRRRRFRIFFIGN